LHNYALRTPADTEAAIAVLKGRHPAARLRPSRFEDASLCRSNARNKPLSGLP
jgi:hypothetical protein